jgi:hypothetical protein
MSFKPAKEKFIQGEMIWGELTVNNRGSERICMSPPYNGQYVSTLGLWASRRIEEEGKEGRWSELHEVTRVNRGEYGDINLQFQGRPIELAPGGSYTASIQLNAIPEFSRSRIYCDRYTDRMQALQDITPGRYRFYIKYVNLERLIPFEERGREPAKRGESKIWALSSHPIVMGPIEIEIVPAMEAAAPEVVECLRADPQSPEGLEKIGALTGSRLLEDPDQSGLLGILVMSYFKRRLVSILESGKERDEALGAIDEQLRQVGGRLPAGPLKDVYGLTRCQILAARGRNEEALALARGIHTPDAEVFEDEMTRKILRQWEREKSGGPGAPEKGAK